MAEDENEQNPFRKPGFLAAAIVTVALVIAGVVLAIVAALGGDSDDETAATPAPTSSSASAAPTAEPTADAEGASVCGLGGVELSGTVTVAPEAQWQYQDVYSYPSADGIGPAETASEGYRYCFQHSPEGALFAASNMVVQSFDGTGRTAWLDYVVSEGTYRDSLLASDQGDSDQDVRAAIAGFRVLAYEGNTSRVDVAYRATLNGEVVYGSLVADMVWADGDWKLNADVDNPARISQLPDLSGYTSWTEG